MNALWLLASVGAAFIVTKTAIFAPLRSAFPKPEGKAPFFGVLVRCPPCVGFHFGWLFFLALAWTEGWVVRVGALSWNEPYVPVLAALAFLHGCASSGVCLFAHLVFVKLGGIEVFKRERHPWRDVKGYARENVRLTLAYALTEFEEEEDRAAIRTAMDLLEVEETREKG